MTNPQTKIQIEIKTDPKQIIENTMKQNAQTNQTKPTNKSNETHWITHSLCGFRVSRKREIERLKRKIRIERNKPEIAKRKMEELVSCG